MMETGANRCGFVRIGSLCHRPRRSAPRPVGASASCCETKHYKHCRTEPARRLGAGSARFCDRTQKVCYRPGVSVRIVRVAKAAERVNSFPRFGGRDCRGNGGFGYMLLARGNDPFFFRRKRKSRFPPCEVKLEPAPNSNLADEGRGPVCRPAVSSFLCMPCDRFE